MLEEVQSQNTTVNTNGTEKMRSVSTKLFKIYNPLWEFSEDFFALSSALLALLLDGKKLNQIWKPTTLLCKKQPLFQKMFLCKMLLAFLKENHSPNYKTASWDYLGRVLLPVLQQGNSDC